jgi:hypothetical protein
MAIALFYISLIGICAILAVKYYNVSFVHHEVISNIVNENDKHVHRIVNRSKHVASQIKFKNFHRLTIAIANLIKKESIYLKRRFDSKQPAFFLSPQKPNQQHKHSVSFFIKNVTDYKNSLKHKDL